MRALHCVMCWNNVWGNGQSWEPPDNGAPWRLLGCLLLLSAGLWMLVAYRFMDAWRLLNACCLSLKTF